MSGVWADDAGFREELSLACAEASDDLLDLRDEEVAYSLERATGYQLAALAAEAYATDDEAAEELGCSWEESRRGAGAASLSGLVRELALADAERELTAFRAQAGRNGPACGRDLGGERDGRIAR